MKKSIIVIVRWGLIISIVAGMKGTTSSPQESMFFKRQGYLINTESVVSTKYQQDNSLIILSRHPVFPVSPELKKKILECIPNRKLVSTAS
ncbi:hypothetical protein PV783_24520 [Chitinophaga sp. CC14]|uniref:hypothetical protein n=1 Tax=Chitinophaga sp. CC14 TaxID=3029199 RepID=UPI003B81A650